MIGDRIKCAAADQSLDRAAVNQALVDTATEIKQILECSARLARFHNIDNSGLTRSLDRAQTIGHRLLIHRGKAVSGSIDVRRQHGQILRQRIVIVAVHLVGVVHIRRQRGCHKCGGVMRFKIGCLIGHQRIGRRVRFIETVAGELFHQVEQLRGQRFLDFALDCTLDENAALLRHLIGVFLSHRATQQIRRTQRIAADNLRDLHHLLLIHDDTVSRLQRYFQIGVEIIGLRTSVFTVDKIFHHARFQRAGAI